jgi:hypothetical protein
VLASHVLATTGAPSERGFALAFAIAAGAALAAAAIGLLIPRAGRGGPGRVAIEPAAARGGVGRALAAAER